MTSRPEGRIVVPVWVDDDIVKALIDANGRMPVNVENWVAQQDVRITGCTITVPVVSEYTSSSIASYRYGWVDSAWRKAPLPLGFSDVTRGANQGTTTGAGQFYVTLPSPSSGEIYVYRGIAMLHNDPTARQMQAGVYDGASYYRGLSYASCAQSVWYGDPIDWVVESGEQLFVTAWFAAAGATVKIEAHGFVVDRDQ